MFTKKSSALLFFMALAIISLTAQSQVYQARPSAAAELKQKIGVTDVTINYSRPQVISNGNDRSGKIYGDLVYYGYLKVNFQGGKEIPWRAGANENTTISFSTDVKVEGKEIKAGKYSLFLVLAEDGKETLLLSKKTDGWGSLHYVPEDDVLKASIESEDCDFTNILTYDFEEIGRDYGLLTLKWEKKKFPIKIEVNTQELTLENFRKVIHHGDAAVELVAAANYCMQNNINHEEAMQWIDKALHADQSFNKLTVKAGLLMQMHKGKEALKIADEASEIANINELNQLGYQMMQLEKFDKAVEYFALNVERNPEDANVYDSLGEGYAAAGEKKKAIKSFKKSLSLDPAPFVKQNSITQLKKLGVEYKD